MRVIVNIDVPDLAPAIDFYCAALGLKLSRTIEGEVAELGGSSSVIYLLQNPAGSHPVGTLPVVRQYSRHWTPVHLDFVVDDVTEAARQALDAGAIQESGCVEWNGSKCITFADPFGNGFCLIEFAGETYGAGDALPASPVTSDVDPVGHG
ncbi:MAG: VOC family protein [Dechloromonas sp.]|nr:VOC family protein [Dechloromonas sp.]